MGEGFKKCVLVIVKYCNTVHQFVRGLGKKEKKIHNTFYIWMWCPLLMLLYVYICKSIFPFVELQDYQMRVEGLLCSPNSMSLSLTHWFCNCTIFCVIHFSFRVVFVHWAYFISILQIQTFNTVLLAVLTVCNIFAVLSCELFTFIYGKIIFYMQ